MGNASIYPVSVNKTQEIEHFMSGHVGEVNLPVLTWLVSSKPGAWDGVSEESPAGWA